MDCGTCKDGVIPIPIPIQIDAKQTETKQIITTVMFTWKLLIVLYLGGIGAVAQQRVLLRDVQTLSLKSNVYTAGRRVEAVPQLNCVGGNGLELAQKSGALPSVVQCLSSWGDGCGL